MKVKCIQIFSSNSTVVDGSSWLKVGGIYHVLGILVGRDRTRLRLVGEESLPALFELEMFEIVSSKIPRTWVIASPTSGSLVVQPAAWMQTAFWEQFYDGNREAAACFATERTKIVEADP